MRQARTLTVAVHPSVEMYGSDRVFIEIVCAIDGPVLAVLPGPGPLADALTSRGIEHQALEFPILRKVELRSPLVAARFLLRFLAAIPRLAWWLRRQEVLALYISTAIAPVWVYAGRLAGCRVYCHIHENESSMSRTLSKILLFPIRSAHGVIANSSATRNWLIGSTRSGTDSRISVVYNGVRELAVDPEPVLSTRTEKNLVVVGRLSQRKGQDVAIRATALLRERGYNVELTLVGDCFPGYEEVVTQLKSLARESGLNDHVHFVGFQDPYSYFARADIAVVPSRVESFGLVAAEAMMLGRPTIATRVGGLPEVIIDGKTGRLIAPNDPAALADTVAALLDAPEEAAELGRQARIDVRRRFSPDGFTQGLRRALANGRDSA